MRIDAAASEAVPGGFVRVEGEGFLQRDGGYLSFKYEDADKYMASVLDGCAISGGGFVVDVPIDATYPLSEGSWLRVLGGNDGLPAVSKHPEFAFDAAGAPSKPFTQSAEQCPRLGSDLPISGRDWLPGSTVRAELVTSKGDVVQRTGGGTVWAEFTADAEGAISGEVPLPSGSVNGDRGTVERPSLGQHSLRFSSGDRVFEQPIALNGVEASASLSVSKAEQGAKLSLRGAGWLTAGLDAGSAVEVLIRDDAQWKFLSHVSGHAVSSSDPRVWAKGAAGADGGLDIELVLPNGTAAGAGGSDPVAKSGAYTVIVRSGGAQHPGDVAREIEIPLTLSEVAPVSVAPAAATSVSVKVSSVKYNYAPTLSVSVKAKGSSATPTGKVTVTVSGKTYSAKLSKGKAKITLDKRVSAGKKSVSVSYKSSNADAFKSSSAKTSFTVKKGSVKVSAKASKSSVKVSAKVAGNLKAKASSLKVQVFDGKKKIKSAKLDKAGKATVKLPKLKKGTHKISVKVIGNDNLTSAKSATQTVKVRLR